MHRLSVWLILCAAALPAACADEPPRSWTDADTGHRVVRLTNEPGSASLYFNQNGYSADGKKMIYTTPEGISVLDLQTYATKPVVKGAVRVIVAGRKAQNVYYVSGVTREIAKLPRRGTVSTVNAEGAATRSAGQQGADDGRTAGGPPAGSITWSSHLPTRRC